MLHSSHRLHPVDDFLRADITLPHPLQAVRDRVQTTLPQLHREWLDDARLHKLRHLLQEPGVVLVVLGRAGDNDTLSPDELAAERCIQDTR